METKIAKEKIKKTFKLKKKKKNKE
ncbi:MAG: hypothetical protein ACI892_001099 [Marinobacter maritimus]|jgi:hypothetical protein